MDRSSINGILCSRIKLHQQVASHLPQIAGHDERHSPPGRSVYPGNRESKGIGCGGRHGRPHVVGVRNAPRSTTRPTQTRRSTGQRRHFRLGASAALRSCAGYGPLGRGRTLGAKFQRIAILALGGAEMAAGGADHLLEA